MSDFEKIQNLVKTIFGNYPFVKHFECDNEEFTEIIFSEMIDIENFDKFRTQLKEIGYKIIEIQSIWDYGQSFLQLNLEVIK